MQLVAVNGNLLSETYELTDAIVHETELTETKTYNISLNDMDFYVEFIVHPTSSTGAIAYINFKDSTTNNLLSIGDIYSNANCGVNWTNGTFSGTTALRLDGNTNDVFWTVNNTGHCRVEYRGTTINVYLDGTLVNTYDSATNESKNFRFRVGASSSIKINNLLYY